MGAAFSTLRRVTDTVFGIPEPSTVRRYGLLLLVFLSVPKYTWDYYRFRQLQQTSRTARDDPNTPKDPVKTVLFNTCTKSMEQLNDAWKLVLVPYCKHATTIREQIEQYFSVVDGKLSRLQPSTYVGEASSEKDEEEDSSTAAVAAYLQFLQAAKDEIPDDDLLKKWSETLDASCKKPLTKMLDLEVEDCEAEEELRELTRALQYLTSMFQDLLLKTRSDVAMKLFSDALQLQQHDQESGTTWPPSSATIRELMIPEEDQSILTLDDKKERQDSLMDLVNRKRAKLLQLQNDCQGRDGVNRENGYFYRYRIDPKILRAAMEEQDIASSTTACILQHHQNLWIGLQEANSHNFYGQEKNRTARERQNEKVVPHHAEHHFLRTMNIELAIQITRTTTDIDKKMGGIKKQRIMKLIKFCWSTLLGSWHLRALKGIGWILTAFTQTFKKAERFFRYNLFLKSVTAFVNVARAMAEKKTSLSVAVTGTTSFFDVCFSIVVLRGLNTLLDDIRNTVDDFSTESIRNKLREKLTHHILSQDLDDITDSVNGQVNARKAVILLGTVQNNSMFRSSIGGVLSIPDDVIEKITGLLASINLLWRQSPRLTVIMICSVLVVERANELIQQLQWWCTRQSGFDKKIFEGYESSQDIKTSIRNFEDMRIAGKEHVIIQNDGAVVAREKMQRTRATLIPHMFRPFRNFLNEVPRFFGAYAGGLLAARNNGISPSNLVGFAGTVKDMLATFDEFWLDMKFLYNMEDHRLTKGLEIVEMFESKPKCGIDGGWKPPAPEQNESESESKSAGAGVANREGTSLDDFTLEMLGPKKHRLEGNISFKNVTFKYKGKQKNMLKGVSFDIPAGSFVGICGESGAGKSTIFKLLLRLHEVRSGVIEMDGKPLQYYNPVFLRSQIGLAKQNPTIFKRVSIRDNVLYGQKHLIMKMGGPLAADKFIKRALTKASIWEKFQNKDKFPLGVDATCTNLSGGEQQRIGIARAVLLTSPILLCDELTSGLDPVTADAVIKNIVANRPPGQTILSVAHKLSTIKDADQIILVCEDGTVETGSFLELSHTSAKFAMMRQAQELGYYKEDNEAASKETKKEAEKEMQVSEGRGRFYEVVTRVIDDLRAAQKTDDKTSTNFFNKLVILRDQISTVDELPARMARALETACDAALRHQGASDVLSWQPYGVETEDAMSKESVELMKREAVKMAKLARLKSVSKSKPKNKKQSLKAATTC